MTELGLEMLPFRLPINGEGHPTAREKKMEKSTETHFILGSLHLDLEVVLIHISQAIH